jgi:hypothetical protein
MNEGTLSREASFRAAAGEILEREHSGGRPVFEEVARLLALDIHANGLVICVRRPDSGTTKLGATWAWDGYTQDRLERAATRGTLCDVLERHRPPVEVDATEVWGFDASELGFAQGLALPVRGEDVVAMVCALFDEEPDAHRAVTVTSELAPFLPRLAP